MKSRSIIMIICWITGILYFTTDIFANGAVPAAFCASFLIMELFGLFKRENAVVAAARINKDGEIEDGLNKRQLDFIRKMEEGAKNNEEEVLSTTIKLMDEHGVEASVTITEAGEVMTEGNPHPAIVQAAKMLQESVINSGPEAIAEELNKQIAKILRESTNDS